MQAPKLFRPLDLAIPLGSCLLAAVLCVLGAVKATTTPARIVCILTGVVFLAGLAGWYLIRWAATRHDFQTVHGIFVRRGKLNRPEKALIEKWTDALLEFWATTEVAKVYRLTPVDTARVISGVWAFFYDESRKEVPRSGVVKAFVVGYAWPWAIGICHPQVPVGGNAQKLDKSYVQSLFRHELSHVIIELQTGIRGEEQQHSIFKDSQLGV